MSYNISAYDTTALTANGPGMKAVEEKLAFAGVAGGGHFKALACVHSEPFDLFTIQGGNSFADAVPFFKHPVLIKNPIHGSPVSEVFAIDLRDFGKWDQPTQSFRVRNGLEYAWHMKRAILNQVWKDSRPEILRDISSIPAAAYASLISESVARRFSLDLGEEMTVRILAAYFYYCLFTDAVDFSEGEKPFLMGKIAQFTHINVSRVNELLADQPCIVDLEHFCEIIRTRVQNIALDNFNIGTLLAVVVGTWFGNNAREILAVGLEHIPTWLTIVDSSLESAVYKRSTLAKIVQRFDKQGAGKSFSRSLEVILGGPMAVTIAETNAIDPNYRLFYSA